jgi:hypothetical protein
MQELLRLLQSLAFSSTAAISWVVLEKARGYSRRSSPRVCLPCAVLKDLGCLLVHRKPCADLSPCLQAAVSPAGWVCLLAVTP